MCRATNSMARYSMGFKRRTLMQIADLICGNPGTSFFVYRSSSYLTEFFADIETDYEHDGSTRKVWVADVLEKILDEPHDAPSTVSLTFARVIQRLMDPADALDEDE